MKKERGLTIKQEKAAQAYVRLGDKSAAYREAYDCSKMKNETANNLAYKLFEKGEIRARVKELQDKVAKKNEITTDYVLNTIRETVERCKQGVPVLDKEGNETGEWKFESFSVLKGAELLAKHLGLFEKDNAQRAGKGTLDDSQRLARIEQILKKAEAARKAAKK